jgi:hypothetical protein
MEPDYIYNAVIKGVVLGYDDHRILTARVTMEYENGVWGFGGYRLDTYDQEKKKSVPHLACGLFIAGVLDAVGVDGWEQLAGKPCRVRCDKPYGSIIGIGHFLKSQWFFPKDEFAKFRA